MKMTSKKYNEKEFFSQTNGGVFTFDLEEYYNGGVNNGS